VRCNHCGAEVAARAKYCEACGAELRGRASEVVRVTTNFLFGTAAGWFLLMGS
jgi:hypothetical protein